MDGQRVTYTPRGPVCAGQSGPFRTLRLMFREVVGARGLAWRLFLRDFSARYRQSVLGIAWAVVMPLVTVGVFIVMNRSGILAVDGLSVPYPLYALVGLSVWNLFTVGLTACSGSLVNAGAMVGKINFPRVALVVAASGQGILEFLIRFFVIAAAFLYFGEAPSWSGVVWGTLALIPLYVLTLGVGFVLALAAAVVRDVLHVLNFALMGAMLLSPILYPIQDQSLLGKMNIWNPINYLINVPRDFIFNGSSPSLPEFFWASLLALGIFVGGWRFFFLAQPKIAERI